MLVAKISAFAFATVAAAAAALTSMEQLAANLGVPAYDVDELLSATDVSSLDITKYTKAMKVDPEEVASWSKSLKISALEQLQEGIQTWVDYNPDSRTQVAKRQQSNRDKVQEEVNELIAKRRRDHESDHGRRLAGCPTNRCTVCATGLTVAYVAALTACGAAAVTEETISAGTLTPIAVTQLGACVALAHSTYAGGWTFCLGMTT
ncbi:hypothetical protein B0J13DRAFT_655663 [Dactylonectria estremocensis]|uniref:Uncharacterized protein n=1 Tax=Dactylonectria estremocensis TaxID=1079267 RepID=A0A9P9ICX5_9HYPO|nr:hypothetical protein B0J13DRAFT_655663 [Dactylonectria estremocensis]